MHGGLRDSHTLGSDVQGLYMLAATRLAETGRVHRSPNYGVGWPPSINEEQPYGRKPEKLALHAAANLETGTHNGNLENKIANHRHNPLMLLKNQQRWRTGRDSNPRWLLHHARFPSVCLKPLGHLSGMRGRPLL